ncbi:MAG TPA: hypothetical protein VM733_11670, partial [Thermoanaerobaculia bacterium]|nr:hypothetical protein [Thermoanaerobaculia bacterium]
RGAPVAVDMPPTDEYSACVFNDLAVAYDGRLSSCGEVPSSTKDAGPGIPSQPFAAGRRDRVAGRLAPLASAAN